MFSPHFHRTFLIAAIHTVFIFSYVIAKDPLKNVMLSSTDGSSNERTAYIIVNGEKKLWSVPMAP